MPPARTAAHPLFDWLVAATSLAFVSGLFIDGWAHIHVPGLETFFTPWHAIFYSGYAVTALAILAETARKRMIPRGYEPALAGAGIFAVGGLLDMTWHIVFGVEADIEALLSPTHLILALGMTLMMTGGLLSWWHRPAAKHTGNPLRELPLILSATTIVSLITFMTQFSHIVDLDAGGAAPLPQEVQFGSQGMVIMGALFHGVVIAGMILLLLKRSRIPFGTVTIMFALNAFAMGKMRHGIEILPAVTAAGLLLDILVAALRARPWAMRVIAFAIPFLYYASTTITMLLLEGSWWSIHMWAGMPVMAGMAGLLLSVIAWPPAMRET